MLKKEIKNPFEYLTPESISAKSALDIFVDVFKEYYNVLNQGNTFINGPRGSGKSMMFRIMKSDCQRLKLRKQLHDLKFYGIHVPVKDTSLNVTDLKILDGKHGANLFNEHFMVIYFAIVIFNSLKLEDYSKYPNVITEVRTFYNNFIKSKLVNSGYKEKIPTIKPSYSVNDIFQLIISIFEQIQSAFVKAYIIKLSDNIEPIPYSGPLFLYFDFLLPSIKEIKKFSFLPKAPIYLMVDDADELSLIQTQILNSWVSFRTTAEVCFKISTIHLRYKSYHTINGSKIDSPHDYFELDLNEIYTSNSKDKYYNRIKEIVEKRLKNAGIKNTTAEKFFPLNKKQEDAIKEIFKKYKDEMGYDYAYRNARPDYMKNLSNKYTYSYSGFKQLVHLSSGIVRNFIDLSSKMYTRVINDGLSYKVIPVSIQDQEIIDYSIKFLKSEFDKLHEDQGLTKDKLDRHKKLYNLIDSIGKVFRIILKSEAKDRRVFSFYFEDEPDNQLNDVLKLGVIYNYFQYSTLGSKTGLGRARLYILNRMLAPYYKLDPNNFSGYKYLGINSLHLAMSNPTSFMGKYKRGEFDSEEVSQLYLFPEHQNEL